MLSVDQVLEVIARVVRPLPPRHLDLNLADGAVLAAPVYLDQDSPAFDRAQLDGFAVRSADAQEGQSLRLLGQIDAGGDPLDQTIAPATCAGINTGAIMPPGADAVLMVEHASRTTTSEGTFITVNKTVPPGYGIQKRASDAAAGELLLPAGITLRAPQLAVCAAAGVGRPLVRALRIAVLTTGDELLDVRGDPTPPPSGKIRNSNHPMLLALARQAAGSAAVLDLATAPDHAPDLRERLSQGLHQADLLLVAGGMSMGTRDLVPPLLKELGVVFHVEKVRMKPGKPFVLGTFEHMSTHPNDPPRRAYVAGLPGNPVSAFVTFHRFAREIIRRLLDQPPATLLRAQSASALPANGDREFYQPCALSQSGPLLIAETLAWKGSADLFSLARSHALLRRPAGAPALPAGAEIDLLPTDWL